MSFKENPELVKFLNELFDTNNEFALAHDGEFFSQFQDKQAPHLTILKCSDSRVQMDSFDKTPQNDVFVIRNIGNQLSTNEGSVDFGIQVLKTPFLLIIGHSGCGAVETVLSGKKTEIPAIDKELKKMNLKSDCSKEAVVENVRVQIDFAMEKYQDLVASGALTIMGGVYDFKDDFGFGKGRLVLTSINGEEDRKKIMQKYAGKVKNLHFL
jgi:carbonic anhydrase